MTGVVPRLDDEGVAAVREAFEAADYTVDGVLDLLGSTAYAALAREETVPALRATTGGSALETLVRLFVLQSVVRRADAEAALPLERLTQGGVLAVDGAEVRALVDIRPYAADDANWWVASDLSASLGGTRRAVETEHVLGVGGASTTLAGLTPRPDARTALDLGTGCGVQALHLSRHVDRVTGSDRSTRALAFADLTARLSGIDLELLEGSLFEPVAQRSFDLVVSNPPFVITPSTGPSYTYRDSGLPGDEVCRRLVGQAPTHLNDGGWCVMLANWLHVAGEDWHERLAGWVVPTGCDAWVVQREVQDPAEYAELWLRDSGDSTTEAYAETYGAWLDAFVAERAEGVGFGWVVLHKSGREQPSVRLEELRQHVDQPLGPEVLDHFARIDWVRTHDEPETLRATLRVDDSLVLEQSSVAADLGWAQTLQRVRLDARLHRSGAIDAFGASVLAACDGTRPLAEVLETVAEAYGAEVADVRSGSVEAVRACVEQGFLHPVVDPP